MWSLVQKCEIFTIDNYISFLSSKITGAQKNCSSFRSLSTFEVFDAVVALLNYCIKTNVAKTGKEESPKYIVHR